MKLSTRARYGTRALLDLAQHQGDAPVQIKDIARRQHISLHYLEHLITPLVGAGIIKSIRGAGGGLRLARPPEEVRLSEVVPLLEGTVNPVECIVNPEDCPRSGACATREVWGRMKRAMDEVLEGVSLADLMLRQPVEEESEEALPQAQD